MRRACVITLLTVGLLAGVPPAAVAITRLTWSPDLQVVAPGNTAYVSVVTADTVQLRTIDVVIEADPVLLLEMQASPGTLFTGLPCMVWEESELLEPGRWHGFAVIIGAECETAGPGELLRWDFTAGQEGVAVVRSVQVKLYAPDGSLFEDVELDHATVMVSGTSDVPPVAPLLSLELAPNPFNPRTVLTVVSPMEDRGTVFVVDLRGRSMARLHDGALPAGELPLVWDGKTDGGRIAPSGAYLFVLRTESGACTSARGILVR